MAAFTRVVFAVDPGKTTGVAMYNSLGIFESREFEDQNDFLDHMWKYMSPSYNTDYEVVCESYIITSETIKKSRQYYSLEIIGALRWMTHQANLPFTLQPPSAGKSFGTDEKLKQMMWYKPGKGHANDAARHLLLYCVKNAVFPESYFELLRGVI